MAARKTERLLNLIFLLLSSRSYLTKVQIRQSIGDYRQASSDGAFDRMFERDKEELRELGIAVDVGSTEPLFGDQEGYRISRDSAELPDIDLTGDEAAIVGLASSVWRNGSLAAGSSAALLKLRSVGVDVDSTVLRAAEPRLSTAEPAFDAVWRATTKRIGIRFDYARPGEPDSTRNVQPWGIVSWRDRWYLTGYDTDRGATRVFRLSRIVGPVQETTKAGAFEVPPDTDIKQVANSLLPPVRTEPAVVRVRRGRCHALRRAAISTSNIDDDFDEIAVPYARARDLASEIASCAADAVAISPEDVRNKVIAQLRFAANRTLAHHDGDGA